MTEQDTEAGSRVADAASGGRTVITERAVEQIARAAAREAGHAGRAGRRLPGTRTDPDAMPASADVKVLLDGHLATVRMRVSAEYPAPVRTVTRRLREHVIDAISSLAGIQVRQVDIEVARFVSRNGPRPR